jgi:hypothetical protein
MRHFAWFATVLGLSLALARDDNVASITGPLPNSTAAQTNFLGASL